MSQESDFTLSRRAFLKSAIGAMAAAALPGWFTEEAIAAESARIAAVPETLGLLGNAVRMGALAPGDAFVCRMGYPLFPQLLSDQAQLISKPLQKGDKPYEHTIYIRDLATQEITNLDKVTAHFCHSFDPDRHPPHLYISPDSQSLLWSSHSGTYVTTLDGQTCMHWPGSLRHCRWMNDSQHWCAWVDDYDEEIGDSFVGALQVYSLDPQDKGILLPLAPESDLRLFYRRIGKAYVTTSSHLLITNWESAQWKQRSDPIQILHLGYEPKLPEGYTVTSMAFSPQGDAIAWIFGEEDCRPKPTGDAALENEPCEYLLAISDTQGADMRTLGTLRSTRYPMGCEDLMTFYFQTLSNCWLADTHRPHHLQWVPMQSRLSFTFDHALWLIATEPEA